MIFYFINLFLILLNLVLYIMRTVILHENSIKLNFIVSIFGEIVNMLIGNILELCRPLLIYNNFIIKVHKNLLSYRLLTLK